MTCDSTYVTFSSFVSVTNLKILCHNIQEKMRIHVELLKLGCCISLPPGVNMILYPS